MTRSIAISLCFVLGCSSSEKSDATIVPAPTSTAKPTPPPAPHCNASAAADLAIATDDENGYPPYAVADCSLVFVDHDGALKLRDLSTSTESVLAPADEKPRRPAIAIEADTRKSVIAWESNETVRVRINDETKTIAGAFVRANEPRVREHFVAFTAWKGPAETDDSDVWLYDTHTGEAKLVLGGPAQQRFADVSATKVVATDFTEDPDGRFNHMDDLADLVVYDIATGAVTKRALPGKQAFPMLGTDDTFAYLDWNAVHPQPKLQAYNLKAGSLANPAGDSQVAYVSYVSEEPARPALAGNIIEWIENPSGHAQLFRAPIDLSAQPAAVPGLDGLFLFAPAPRIGLADNPGFTLVGAVDYSKPQPSATLRAVAR